MNDRMKQPAETLATSDQPEALQQLARLLAVMARLRDPHHGCAWDLQQDFASIAPYTIEEAYEVAEAIAEGSPEDIRDELGDLLLQVVFQAQIGRERGLFDFAAISTAITEKMIRRHPHIFADAAERSASEQRLSWEAIKAEERKQRQHQGVLDGIASSLPAVTRAVKLQQRAARVGFDWQRADQVLEKIREELDELASVLHTGGDDGTTARRDELGDLLFAVINLARKLDIDPEEALNSTNRKFVKRFNFIEQYAENNGLSVDKLTLEEMEAQWNEAKRLKREQKS